MMLRRVDFDRVGRFAPRYFMYAEDMDLCLQIGRRGLRVLYAPTASVIHYGGGSSKGQFAKFSVVMKCEALESYFRANYGLASARMYRTWLVISAVARIALLTVARFIPRESVTQESVSLRKWLATLSWSLGRERWARSYRPS